MGSIHSSYRLSITQRGLSASWKKLWSLTCTMVWAHRIFKYILIHDWNLGSCGFDGAHSGAKPVDTNQALLTSTSLFCSLVILNRELFPLKLNKVWFPLLAVSPNQPLIHYNNITNFSTWKAGNALSNCYLTERALSTSTTPWFSVATQARTMAGGFHQEMVSFQWTCAIVSNT